MPNEEQRKKWNEELSWLTPEKREKIISEREAGHARSGVKWTSDEKAQVNVRLNDLVEELSKALKRAPNAILWEVWAQAGKMKE